MPPACLVPGGDEARGRVSLFGDVELARVRRLSARVSGLSAVAWIAFWYLATAAVILSTNSGHAVATVVTLVAVPAAVVIATLWMASRLMQRRLPGGDVRPWDDPALARALAPARVRSLTIALVVGAERVLGRRSLASAFRVGPSAVIVLRGAPGQGTSELTAFFLAHELGHLLRRDYETGGLRIAALAGAACAAIIAAPGALWVVFPLVGLLFVVPNWSAELACDRLAVQIVGEPPARAFISLLDRNRQRRSTQARVRRQVRDLGRHPPDRLRRRVICRAIVQVAEDEAPRTEQATGFDHAGNPKYGSASNASGGAS
jgi:Zn-dependent protease with chaperone function